MFRWIRSFGQLLKKPKGVLQTEKSTRARSAVRDTANTGKISSSSQESITTRSSAGSCNRTSQSRSVSFTRSVRSGSAAGRKTNSSACGTTSTRSSRSQTRKSNTNSELKTGKSRFGRSESELSRSTAQHTRSSVERSSKTSRLSRRNASVSRSSQSTNSKTASSVSTGRTSTSQLKTGKSRFDSNASDLSRSTTNQTRSSVEQSSKKLSTRNASTTRRSRSINPKSTSSVSTGRSRFSSNVSQARTASYSKRNFSTRSSGRSHRGRDRTRRVNVNANRSSRSEASNLILSPTNRSHRLNRSASQDYENKFKELQKNKQLVWNQIFPKDTVVIYTDGSYLPRSGKLGIGIFMGPDHELNRSHRIRGSRGDNNYAEFIAVRTALENLKSWPGYKNEKVKIRTDSMNVIDSLSGKNVMYPKLCDEIKTLTSHFPNGVDFEHVYAHSDDPGNEMADILAGVATSKTQVNVPCRSASTGRRSSAKREHNRRRSMSNDREFIRSHSLHLGPK